MQLKHAENKSQKLDRDYERAIDENQKKFENSQKDLEHQHKRTHLIANGSNNINRESL